MGPDPFLFPSETQENFIKFVPPQGGGMECIMILSLEWLAEFVNTAGIDTKQFCDRMTATGSKVEGYEVLGDDIQNVKVGRIVALRRHENSDHLQI